MRVEVYWNFHRKCYSVRALEGPEKGRVVDHLQQLVVKDAKLVVRQAGRAKVLREKRKNVHAFVRGTWVARSEWHPVGAQPVGLAYNPYVYESFMAIPEPADVAVAAFEARMVHLTTTGLEPRSSMRAVL